MVLIGLQALVLRDVGTQLAFREAAGSTPVRMLNQNNGVILSADMILEALRG